jgi:hypothetical protein
MKTKLEDFKDRSELFRWASEGKPIWVRGRIFYTCYKWGYNLRFDIGLHEYKKVVEIETETIAKSHDMWVYLRGKENIELAFGKSYAENDGSVFAKIKITATIGKCKATGEIISKDFKLEEVE